MNYSKHEIKVMRYRVHVNSDVGTLMLAFNVWAKGMGIRFHDYQLALNVVYFDVEDDPEAQRLVEEWLDRYIREGSTS